MMSALRDDKSTKMAAGSIKRRRIKHKITADQERISDIHDDTVRSQVSAVSRVSHSPFSAQRRKSRVVPVSPISHAQPNALFTPTKSKSKRNQFFKRGRIKKVKSILKSTRSLPHVKERRSAYGGVFMRYATTCATTCVTISKRAIAKRGAKQKKVRWADPLVQIINPVVRPLKHGPISKRSVTADSSDAVKRRGRNSRPGSRCKSTTRGQSKAAIFGNPKSDINECRPTTNCELPTHRSPPTTKQQSRKSCTARRDTQSLVSSQRKGMVSPQTQVRPSSGSRPYARTRSSQSLTVIDSKGRVHRKRIKMPIMSYPRKAKAFRKPQDGRRRCVNPFSTNKSRRSHHR